MTSDAALVTETPQQQALDEAQGAPHVDLPKMSLPEATSPAPQPAQQQNTDQPQPDQPYHDAEGLHITLHPPRPLTDADIGLAPAKPLTDADIGLVSPPAVSAANSIDAQLQQHFDTSIKAAIDAVPPPADGSPKAPMTFSEAISAGWGNSVLGLMENQKVPETVDPSTMTTAKRIAMQTSSLAGDFPFMFAGGVGGAMAGGPAAPITGAAGAMALPAFLRSTMIDAYKNGTFKSPMDFLHRASGIFVDTLKAADTGAATATVGGIVEAASKGLPAAAQTASTATAQVLTMATVSKALEGHLPTAQDFTDAAILTGGLMSAGMLPPKLMTIYEQTGKHPMELAAEAQRDPSLKQELLSKQVIPARLKSMVAPMFKKVKAAVTPTAGPVLSTNMQKAQDNILSKIEVGGKDKTARYSFAKFYADWVDNLAPVKDAIKAMAGGKDVPIGSDAYKMLRLNRGSFARAEKMILHSTTDYNTYKSNGKGLSEILEPVKNDLDGFRAYVAAKRAIELEGRGIQSGLDVNDAKMMTQPGANDVEGQARVAKFAKAQQELVGYQNRVTKYLKDSGVIDKKTYDAMTAMNKDYVPFYRVMDDGAGGISSVKGQVQNPLRGIEGSSRHIIDPLESIIKNTYAYVTLAEKNGAHKAFFDLADSTGNIGKLDKGALIEKVKTPVKGITVQDKEMQKFLKENGIDELPEEMLTVFRAARQPLQDNQVAVFTDGKREVYEMDKDLAGALKDTNRLSFSGLEGTWLGKFILGASRLQRAGTIFSPDFMPRHITRQQFAAFINSPDHFIPVYDTLKSVSDVIRQKDAWAEWMASGGGNADLAALDRRYIQHSLSEITGAQSIGEWIARTKNDPGSLLKLPYNTVNGAVDMAHLANATMENALRLGQYKNTVARQDSTSKATMMEAAYNSREVGLDYARSGIKSHAVNQLWNFFNMKMLGLDKTAENFMKRPSTTAVKLGAGIVLPTMMLWWANKDDPRWKSAPDWQRDNFWIVPTDEWRGKQPGDYQPQLDAMAANGLSRQNNGQTEYNFGTTYRIPKPPDTGQIIASMAERFLDAMYQKDPTQFERFGKDLMNNTFDAGPPNFASPIIEQFANRSTFTGGPIIPSNAETVLPEEQYAPYTSDTAKLLGHAIGSIPAFGQTPGSIASPAVVDNYIRGWSGGNGVYVTKIADFALRKAGIVPDVTKPTAELSDIPFIGAFTMRYPSSSSQNVQDFYAQYNHMTAVMDTIKLYAKQGNPVAAMAMYNQNKETMVNLTNIAKGIGKAHAFVNYVYQNPQLSADDKRKLIDTTYYQMQAMAQRGLDQIKIQASNVSK